MLSNHGLPYVGRFACDWPRLSTTDPRTATRWECRPGHGDRSAARGRRAGGGDDVDLGRARRPQGPGRGRRPWRPLVTTSSTSRTRRPATRPPGGEGGPGAAGGERLGRSGPARAAGGAAAGTARPRCAGHGPGQELGLVEAPLRAGGPAWWAPTSRRRPSPAADQRGHRPGQERHRRPGVAVLQPGHQLPRPRRRRRAGRRSCRRPPARAATAPAAARPRTPAQGAGPCAPHTGHARRQEHGRETTKRVRQPPRASVTVERAVAAWTGYTDRPV